MASVAREKYSSVLLVIVASEIIGFGWWMFRFSGLFNEENGLYFCNDDASHFGRSNGFGGKSWNVLISCLRGKKIVPSFFCQYRENTTMFRVENYISSTRWDCRTLLLNCEIFLSFRSLENSLGTRHSVGNVFRITWCSIGHVTSSRLMRYESRFQKFFTTRTLEPGGNCWTLQSLRYTYIRQVW